MPDRAQVCGVAVLRLQTQRSIQAAQGPRRGQARANLGVGGGGQRGPACSRQHAGGVTDDEEGPCCRAFGGGRGALRGLDFRV